jgi:VCBS repeat-containing protein
MAQPITNLSVGDKIKYGTYQVEGSTVEPVIRMIIGFNHYKDELNPDIPDHVTVIPWKIQDLRGFDAKEPSNADSNRQQYGNNRYKDSNIRQWLNSGGPAGSWWSATHGADAAPADAGMSQPTGYDDIPGYLSNFTANELSKILDTTIRVVKNTVTDGGGSETVVDKVFLLSTTEVGLGNENDIAEGTPFTIFNSDASRISYATAQCIANTLSSSKPADDSTGWYWWLRTPSAGLSYGARYVHSDGTLSHYYAYHGHFGVRPALNLASDILVSDTVDADGAYTIEWNQQPVVTIVDATYPNVRFTVSDADGTVQQVDVYVNGILKETYDSGLDAEIVYPISYADLNEGDNTLEIVATDNLGGEGVKLLNINKTDITVPTAGTKVVIKGKQYTITDVVNDGITLTLTLDRPLEENIITNESVELLNNYVVPSADLGNGFAELNHVKTTYSGDQAAEKYELDAEGRTVTFKVNSDKESGSTMEISKPKAIFQYKGD